MGYLEDSYSRRQSVQGCSLAARHHPQQGHLRHRQLAPQALTYVRLADMPELTPLPLDEQLSSHSILWRRATTAVPLRESVLQYIQHTSHRGSPGASSKGAKLYNTFESGPSR